MLVLVMSGSVAVEEGRPIVIEGTWAAMAVAAEVGPSVVQRQLALTGRVRE